MRKVVKKNQKKPCYQIILQKLTFQDEKCERLVLSFKQHSEKHIRGKQLQKRKFKKWYVFEVLISVSFRIMTIFKVQ